MGCLPDLRENMTALSGTGRIRQKLRINIGEKNYITGTQIKYKARPGFVWWKKCHMTILIKKFKEK